MTRSSLRAFLRITAAPRLNVCHSAFLFRSSGANLSSWAKWTMTVGPTGRSLGSTVQVVRAGMQQPELGTAGPERVEKFHTSFGEVLSAGGVGSAT